MSSFLPFFHNLLSTGVIPLGRYNVFVSNFEKASNFDSLDINSITYTHQKFTIVENPNEGSCVEFSHINGEVFLKYENGSWVVKSKWSR